MKKKNNTCSRAAKWEPKLYNYAENVCTEEEKRAVEEHLAVCAACRETLADIRWMLSAVRAGAPETVSVADAVMERIHTGDTPGENLLQAPAVRIRRISGAVGGLAAALVLLAGAIWVAPTLSRVSAGNAGTENVGNTALTAAQVQKYTDGDGGAEERSVCESTELFSGVQYALKMPEAVKEDAAVVAGGSEMPCSANDAGEENGFPEEYANEVCEEAAAFAEDASAEDASAEAEAEKAVGDTAEAGLAFSVSVGLLPDAERDAVRELLEQCTKREGVVMTEYRSGWLVSRSAYDAVYEALSERGLIAEMSTAAQDAGQTAQDLLYVYICMSISVSEK